ncbi:MAG TPA: (d)CMP kinase [Usitatibacter sp.]|nr:(d)CMP kinase [Usitatibacter sp.]
MDERGLGDPRAHELGSVPIIAIDGPSASGKGTVAARVAQALGFHYLDSGALYRLVALAALRQGVALDDSARLAALARGMDVAFDAGSIRLGADDVTHAVRAEDVGAAASRVASQPPVREALLARQRDFRRLPGLVADGRDMGSVVFPAAPLKVFLTADVGTRAERRYKQLMEKGMCARMEDVVEDLASRDARDASRAVAPLKHYPDAFFLDTTGLTVDQAVERILGWWRDKAAG